MWKRIKKFIYKKILWYIILCIQDKKCYQSILKLTFWFIFSYLSHIPWPEPNTGKIHCILLVSIYSQQNPIIWDDSIF